jgi:hypothetical protein
MKKILVLLLVIFLSAGLLGGPSAVTRCDDTDYGVEAYRLLRIINDNYPQRINASGTGGTETKTAMLQWIDETMASYGYSVHGNYKGNNFEDPTPVYSHTFVKQGRTSARILIGAHYDCVDTNGCEDNGSGVAVALELARRFAGTETNLTLEFGFWDGEETLGSAGSRSYITQSPDLGSVMLVINLDSVGAGDSLFVYGGKYQGTSLRQVWGYNMARDIAMRVGIDLRQMPIQVEHYQSPTRSDASDQVWFYRNDIPYVYFEANAWINESGEVPFPQKPYNYNSQKNVFRPTDGRIIHTEYDDMDKLEEMIPGVQMNHMRETSTIVSWMIREMTTDTPAVYEPLYEGKVYTANGWVTYNHGVAVEGNPPATEPPVTEPPVTEPPATEPVTEPPVTEPPATEPVTEPPVTDAPSGAPSGSEHGAPSETAPSGQTDPVPGTSEFRPTGTDPGRESSPGRTTEDPDDGQPAKKRGNALGFWLLEGSILLVIGLLALYLILTRQAGKPSAKRRRRKRSARRKR